MGVTTPLSGLLLVDKPTGWTSFDVVAKVRSILREQKESRPKVGHSGTLDPAASGLLLVMVGDYCRRASYFSSLDKTYSVSMKLGFSSSTGDGEGHIRAVGLPLKAGRRPIVRNDFLGVIGSFLGEVQQTPPAYSAIKVAGQRAYKLARAGKVVKLKPRMVTIHEIQLSQFKYPDVKFTARVSSGTYIRSLVEDIGRALGTCAYTSGLRRTAIGTYSVTNALKCSNLELRQIQTALLT